MKIAFIGLGKMGMNMAVRLKEKNHQVAAFDVSSEARDGGHEVKKEQVKIG